MTFVKNRSITVTTEATNNEVRTAHEEAVAVVRAKPFATKVTFHFDDVWNQEASGKNLLRWPP